MVVHGRRGRLHEEDLFTPNWLVKLDHHFTVGVAVDLAGAYSCAQLTCDCRRQSRVGRAGQNRKLVAHAYLRLPRIAQYHYDAITVALGQSLRATNCVSPSAIYTQ